MKYFEMCISFYLWCGVNASHILNHLFYEIKSGYQVGLPRGTHRIKTNCSTKSHPQ